MPDLSIKKWDEVNGLGSSERMEAFLTSSTDAYAILQLRYSDETSKERFMSMSSLKRLGLEPDIDHYEVVYVGNLEPYKDRETMLEEMYATFNINHPSDFRGHSLSVSDIVALQEGGKVSCHYVDSVGYAELPGFLRPENYLKNAEMMLEDDYSMIDGYVNNGSRNEPFPERASVMEQLKEAANGPAIQEKTAKPPKLKERAIE